MPKKSKSTKKTKKPASVKTPAGKGEGAVKKINPIKKTSRKQPQLLRGFRDVLPNEERYWDFIQKTALSVARSYGFKPIILPILESADLFRRAVGEATDIVEKEMFTFNDRGGETVTLRPEMTASTVRAYIEHGMLNLPQPVKLYYFGPAFRHDRPQAGRLRQFHQFGIEALGDDSAVIDSQVIFIGYIILKELGLDYKVQVNSVGCSECRKEFRKELLDYYRKKKKNLCEDCQKRISENPLRLLDCKNEECQRLREGAPQTVDWLCDECKDHFMSVLEYLDDLEVPYNLNPYLVRGLDYYNRTVFEIWEETEEQKSQNSLLGGGRYDYLTQALSGRPTPGLGFSLGVERTIIKLKENNINVPVCPKPEIFIAQLGSQARSRAMILFEKLRQKNLRVAESFSKEGLKAQLEIANKLGVRYTLILGQKEVLDGTIIIRDMEGGIQEIVAFDKIISELEKKL